MKQSNRERGYREEARAAEYLQQLGFRILKANFYTKFGEIDIVASEDPYLVFVEVKYRKSAKYGMPAESVNAAKRKKICLAARVYRMQNRIADDVPIRFDVISITGEEIQLIRNAFEAV